MLMASLAFISSKNSQIWAGITEAGEIMQPLLTMSSSKSSFVLLPEIWSQYVSR